MKFDAMEVVETSCRTVSNVCYTCQCFARVDGPVEMLLKVEQGRAGQGRAGQGRAGQGRAGQDTTGPARAGQSTQGACTHQTQTLSHITW